MDRAATMNKPGRVSIAVAIVAMTAAVSTCPHVDGTPALKRSQRSSIETHLPPLPSLTPFSRAKLASLPGPSTVSPSSLGPQDEEKISTSRVFIQPSCCLLTLSKACDRARPSKVSDIRPSSILCKYLIINVHKC